MTVFRAKMRLRQRLLAALARGEAFPTTLLERITRSRREEEHLAIVVGELVILEQLGLVRSRLAVEAPVPLDRPRRLYALRDDAPRGP